MSTLKETGLSVEDAAQFLGCSPYTIRELCRRSEIPFYKVGGRYRFRSSSLLRFIDTQEKKHYKIIDL